MKKIIINSLFLAAFGISAQAQMQDFYVANPEPVIISTMPVEQLPVEVRKSVDLQFDRNNPLTWSKFPFAMAQYGWVYDLGIENTLDHFTVEMKTDKETDLWAMYTKEGELIETREESKNVVLPAAIRNEIAKSEYSDWRITETKEIVRFSHNHNYDKSKVRQKFQVKVEKDGAEKSLTFNWSATAAEVDFYANREIDKLKYDMLVSK
jgi:hypothetical protein